MYYFKENMSPFWIGLLQHFSKKLRWGQEKAGKVSGIKKKQVEENTTN